MGDPIEEVVAPAAIERALMVYQQLKPCDQSVLLQARKILTQNLFIGGATQSHDVRACFAEKYFEFASERSAGPEDGCALDAIATEFSRR